MRSILFLCLAMAFSTNAYSNVADAQNAASRAIQAGDYAAAIDMLSETLQAEPDNARSHYLAAAAYLGGRSDLGKAGFHLAQAERLGLAPQPLSLLRARFSAATGDLEAAIAEIESLAAGGFAQPARLENADFEVLRDDPRFKAAARRIDATRYPCKHDARYRAFDFWVGRWVVTQSGTYVGDNDIASILEGCLLFEQWQSATGLQGKSFNYFDPSQEHWRQIWVSDSGTIIEFTGHSRDGGIYYSAETTDPSTGTKTFHRFEFTQLDDGTVRQFWATSNGDEEWNTIWDAVYTRAEE